MITFFSIKFALIKRYHLHRCNRVWPLFGMFPQWNLHVKCHVNEKKINRNQKRITLWDIQLSSLTSLLYFTIFTTLWWKDCVEKLPQILHSVHAEDGCYWNYKKLFCCLASLWNDYWWDILYFDNDFSCSMKNKF